MSGHETNHFAEQPDPGKGELRRGWTTGTCATGAAKAAYGALLGHGFRPSVVIPLPRGGEVVLPLADSAQGDGWASAAITKDAGDDPDVTHGSLVRAVVRPGPRGLGVRFAAGDGIGRVTRPGLALAPGEPAINPVPRSMIRQVVETLAATAGVAPDVEVTISIPGGDKLALKTLNPRLGIEGGLSILGTTGVVVPFSCSAWIHSIHRGIDVARASSLRHVAAATGSTSERMAQQRYSLPDMALIDMGDFVGGTLKYLKRRPLPRLTLAGGFGKLVKLAQGALDLHSSRSTLDRVRLAQEMAALGGAPGLVAQIHMVNTANEALGLAAAAGLPLGRRIAELAREVALTVTGDALAMEVIVVDRAGEVVGHAPGW